MMAKKIKTGPSAYEQAAKRDLETATDFIQITTLNVIRFHQDHTDYKAVDPKAIRKEMINLRKALRNMNNAIKGIEPEE